MYDALKNNRPSKIPMACRLEVEMKKAKSQDNEFINRLITSLYLTISCCTISILIAMLLGIDG